MIISCKGMSSIEKLLFLCQTLNYLLEDASKPETCSPSSDLKRLLPPHPARERIVLASARPSCAASATSSRTAWGCRCCQEEATSCETKKSPSLQMSCCT